MNRNVSIARMLEEKRTLSFELFPPRSADDLPDFFNVVSGLKALDPDFISVTYGAGGKTRDKTMDLTMSIQHWFQVPTMHHLTCVGTDREFVGRILSQMKVNGIRNILALRGDMPEDDPNWTPPENGFSHAFELCRFVKENDPGFTCGVAGFPEGHPESPDMETDLAHLRTKMDSGAEFIITQFFFDNADYFNYVDRVREMGIEAKIIPGIMPIRGFRTLERFAAKCGASIPPEMTRIFRPIEKDLDAVRRKGVEFTLEQCRELAPHVPGFHFYTLNHVEPTRTIVKELMGGGR